MPPSPENPQAARHRCEALLHAERDYRITHSILFSEIDVIYCLLERGLELTQAYVELDRKLGSGPPALKVLFDLLLGTAAFWSPQANQAARRGRARLIEVNREIVDAANALVALLEERTELNEHSGFSCNTFYHPVDVLHAASGPQSSYSSRVKAGLDALTAQFDIKYWPSLGDVVQAIGDDAARASPVSHDPVTHAGTEGARAGLADSFRAFFKALEEAGARNFGWLPSDFSLTDGCVASLMNCALNLSPEQGVDATYVKRLRQRGRERQGVRRTAACAPVVEPKSSTGLS